jgi:uncharacterized damage-inducible protein DinB
MSRSLFRKACANVPFRRVRGVAVVTTALMLGAAASPVAAQVMNRESAVEVRKQFLADLDSLQSKFLQLANAIPAEKYSWRPGDGVRSIGEVFMHVASEWYVYTPMAYGAKASPVVTRTQEGFASFEKASSKADALKHLTEGFAYARQAIVALPEASITGTQKLFGGNRTIAETSFSMTDDLHEHLGQLIAYARMNGIKPPWSR